MLSLEILHPSFTSITCHLLDRSHSIHVRYDRRNTRVEYTSRVPTERPTPPLSFMSYFQTLITLLTDDTPPPPSSNTRSSSRSTSNSLFTTAFPSSLPNVHIRARSPSRHSPARQPISSHLQTQSPFHSITRTLRSYVPSSIHIPIPSAAPSPPLVSRPVSFGRFSSDSGFDTTSSGLGLGLGDATRGRKLVSRQEFERDYEREGGEEDEYYAYGGHGYGYGYQQPPTSGLARTMTQNHPPGFNTHAVLDKSSGRTSGMDVIEWTKWDVLGDR